MGLPPINLLSFDLVRASYNLEMSLHALQITLHNLGSYLIIQGLFYLNKIVWDLSHKLILSRSSNIYKRFVKNYWSSAKETSNLAVHCHQHAYCRRDNRCLPQQPVRVREWGYEREENCGYTGPEVYFNPERNQGCLLGLFGPWK